MTPLTSLLFWLGLTIVTIGLCWWVLGIVERVQRWWTLRQWRKAHDKVSREWFEKQLR